MIYHGMYIERTNSDTSLVGPCCNGIPEPVNNNQVSFSANPLLLKLREENSQGLWSNACAGCTNNERLGFRSYRTTAINNYGYLPPETGLYRIDYNVDPICNSKCIICDPRHSSAWAQENERFSGSIPVRTAASSRSNKIINDVDLSSLEYIYFNGGEPVLSTDPELILGKLKSIDRLSKVNVALSMNGSLKPRQELVDLLLQAKSVDIIFSIDGVGEQFEYIRNPLIWDDVLDTVRYVIDLPIENLTVGSSCAIGLHNVDYVEAWNSWWESYTTELVSKHSRTTPVKLTDTVQLVHGILHISNAPQGVKEQWLTYLEQSKHRVWYPLVVGTIQESLDKTTNRDWANYLDKLDLRRGNRWPKALSQFYERCVLAGGVK